MKYFYLSLLISVVSSLITNTTEFIDRSKFGGPSKGRPRIEWYSTQLDYTKDKPVNETFRMRYIIDD